MNRRIRIASLLALTLTAAARGDDKPAAKAAAFDQLKKLAGTWVAADEKGQPTDRVVSVFKVTAAGSAVQETIFPGSDHEMVSVYHVNGKDVEMTHYCALGNQPHLKLDPASPKGRYDFQFVGGSNLDAAKDRHMHEGSLTVVDDDHLEWSWQAWAGGKPSGGDKAQMKLVRKK
jgi:hypothetical protein